MNKRIFVSAVGVLNLRTAAVEQGDFANIYEFADKFFDRLTNEKDGMYFSVVAGGKYVIDGPDHRVLELIEYAKKVNEKAKNRSIKNLIDQLEKSFTK